jgi:hypothetical protein
MKNFFYLFLLMCAFNVYAEELIFMPDTLGKLTLRTTPEDLVITPDMLGGQYSIALGGTITVVPKDGHKDEADKPHYGTGGLVCSHVSVYAWSFTPSCEDEVGIGYANTQTFVEVTSQPVTKYTLTVNNGSGGGNYEAGASVSITANTAPSGQTFDKWTGDVSGVANVNGASTTYTMGSTNAMVTATYKDDIPDGMENISTEPFVVRGAEKALYIKSPNEGGTVQIYSTIGILVKETFYSVGENLITLSVTKGVYFIRVPSEKKTFKVYIQ